MNGNKYTRKKIQELVESAKSGARESQIVLSGKQVGSFATGLDSNGGLFAHLTLSGFAVIPTDIPDLEWFEVDAGTAEFPVYVASLGNPLDERVDFFRDLRQMVHNLHSLDVELTLDQTHINDLEEVVELVVGGEVDGALIAANA